MMVAEGCVTCKFNSPFCQIGKKSGWIANATKREELSVSGWLIILRADGLAVSFHAEQFGTRVKDGRGGVAMNHRFGGRCVFAARNDDNIGAAQRGNWFAKAARRKKIPTA